MTYGWLSQAVIKHDHGDDADFATLVAAVLSAHEAITIEEHAARVHAFLPTATHPTLRRAVHLVRVSTQWWNCSVTWSLYAFIMLHRLRRRA